MWDFLNRIGSGIASGAQKLRDPRIMDGGSGRPSPLSRPSITTPSFNPAAKGGIESINTDRISAPILNRPSVGSAGINPIQPPPEAMPASPLPRPNNSAVGVPIPQLPGRHGEPIPYSQMEKARYDHVMEGAKRGENGQLLGKDEGGGIKRSWKDIGTNALLGGLQGMATGGLGGALGGAAVGGIGSAISPQIGREYGFNMLQKPGLERQQKEQDIEAARQRDIQDAQLNQDLKRGQIGNYKSLEEDRRLDRELKEQEIKERYKPKTLPSPRPISVAPGHTVIDPATGKLLYTAPASEKPISDATQMRQIEGEMEDEEGPIDEIARSSTEGRIPSLIESLPTQFRSILQTGKLPDGSDPLPEDLLRAEQALAAAKERDYQGNRSATRTTRKQKARQQAQGGAKPLPRPSGGGQSKASASAGLVDFTAKKLGISPEEAKKRLQDAGY